MPAALNLEYRKAQFDLLLVLSFEMLAIDEIACCHWYRHVFVVYD